VLTAAIALGVFAVLLAWPIPVALAAAKWPSRAPGFALLLWQGIALAGGLSMIGSLLTFGLVPFGNTLRTGLVNASQSLVHGFHATGADVVSIVALGGAILLGLHLLLNLAFTIGVTGRERRRHRALVDILSSPSPDRPNTRLIDSAAPVAYCLPGSIDSLTVLSQGIVSLLDDPQLHSVIEHERAHLRQRHSAVLLAFDAWRSSLPGFRSPVAPSARSEPSSKCWRMTRQPEPPTRTHWRSRSPSWPVRIRPRHPDASVGYSRASRASGCCHVQ